MIYGSACSGIEAATVAWAPLGWRAAWFAERDPEAKRGWGFPAALLAHRYPDIPNLGLIEKAHERDEFRAAAINVLVGGTPCQSFSVAGLRKGLDDPRGNLALVFLGLAQRARPAWLVWENVPGVLSSGKGRDLGAFLGALAQLGYGWAYRVLDAQYFNLAQRRARVFVVGYLGDWRRAAAVLFDSASLRGDSPPSREAGEGVAADVAPSIGASGRGFSRAGESRGQDPVIPILEAGARTGKSTDDPRAGIGIGKPGDPMFSLQAGKQHAIAHALRADGFDASEDGTGRGTPLVAFGGNQTSGPLEIAAGINAKGGSGRMDFETETLIAFSAKNDGADAGELAPTLRAMGHDESHPNAGGQVAVAQPLRSNVYNNSDPGMEATQHVQTPWGVRRLTPREYERLQGFPDDYTLVPYRGKPAADGPRYKALGNSMPVPVLRWIGERIEAILREAA